MGQKVRIPLPLRTRKTLPVSQFGTHLVSDVTTWRPRQWTAKSMTLIWSVIKRQTINSCPGVSPWSSQLTLECVN